MRTLSTIATAATVALLLAGCGTSAPSDRDQACDDLYAVSGEFGHLISSENHADVARVATKVADAAGSVSEFSSLRAAAQEVVQSAVDPSTASSDEIEQYASSLDGFGSELMKVDGICEA